MKTLHILKTAILFVLSVLLFEPVFSQVLISEGTGSPDNSAMLEIQSNSKGVLIPRLTTSERTSISNPAEGLLVYDSDLQSFFIYGKTDAGSVDWYNISDQASIWSRTDTMVYLSESNYNVGIGTTTPNKKLVIRADNENDTLLEILNHEGFPLMIVTPKLTKFNFFESSKGIAGGFAVHRYKQAKDGKALSDTTLFLVTPDSTRVYTSGAGGVAGGFAVGRYNQAKGDITKYFFTNVDSTTINVQDSVAGFKVINTGTNSEQEFMRMSTENSFLGHESGLATVPGGTTSDNGKYNSFIGYRTGHNNIIGKSNVFIGHLAGYTNTDNYNVFIGHEAGYSNQNGTYNLFIGFRSGQNNTSGDYNSFFGYQAGRNNIGGLRNVFIGPNSGYNNTEGDDNLFLGYQSGNLNQTGNRNVFLGRQAGRSNVSGSDNVCIGYQAGYNETGSDKLYIDNTNTSAPLIWGDFNTNQLGFYGNVCIGGNLNGGGTRVLSLINGTLPTNSIANGVLLYTQDISSSSELRVRDEAGNITTLSPHNFSLIKKSEPMAWSYYSENTKTGSTINVDMLRAVRLIEEISGEKLVYINNQNITDYNDEGSNEKSYKELIKDQQILINDQHKKIMQLLKETELLRIEQEKMKEKLDLIKNK